MDWIKTAKESCSDSVGCTTALVTITYFKLLKLLTDPQRSFARLSKLPSFLVCYDPGLQEPQILKGCVLLYDYEVWAFDTENTEHLCKQYQKPKKVSSCRYKFFWPTLAIPIPRSFKILLADQNHQNQMLFYQVSLSHNLEYFLPFTLYFANCNK